jgi:ribosome-associated protein
MEVQERKAPSEIASQQDEEDVQSVCQKIFDKKGFNILALDVRGISTMTDFFVIAEGNVDRHVVALAKEVRAYFQAQGKKPFRTEGERDGDWVVLDYGNLVVHLFIPDLREKYKLEQVWKAGLVVPVTLFTRE